jgi:hypothetical protein
MAGMKPRHAAALALAGWYLMVPPSMSEMDWTCGASLSAFAYHKLFGTGDEKDCAKFAEIEAPNAPIAKWHEMSPFETLLDCEKAQHELLTRSRAGSPQAGALCVATDDPRLKGN